MSVLASSGAAPGSRDNGHSSAAVLEFVCLFTHDLRRKQKRWQDGRLKYHTFNKRVMVYDERGNFIGDMYWRRDWDFDEGEEIELERGGVIVQVAECVGRQNQDLSELIDKRAKEKEQRAAQRPAVPFVPMHTPLSITRTPAGQRDHFQTRHRPLNQLLGTPTGHHGRALVPTESPYEQRRAADRTPDEESSSRAQKRRRHDDLQSSKMGYAQALFGAPLTLSGASMSSAPIRRPALPRPQPRIDLTSSQEDGLSDSRPFGVTGEPNRNVQRPSPGLQPRTVQSRGEQAPRQPLTTGNNNRLPTRREAESHTGDEDQAVQPTSHRGVSGHFGKVSEESEKRTSLLKTARQKIGHTRDPPPIAPERRVENPRQTPVQQPPKTVAPITIPDDDDELFVQDDAQNIEDETPVTWSAIIGTSRREQSAKLSEREAPREQQVQRRSSGTPFKMDSFAHSTTTDNESDAPEPAPASKRLLPAEPAEPAPAPAPPIEPPREERRTELRLKSRGRRLLVLSEMAKEAPAKTRKKRRAPRPEPVAELEPETELELKEPVVNINEENYNIPEDFLEELDPEPPRRASPKPAFANVRTKEAARVEPGSSDPFATQRPPSVKERAKSLARKPPPGDPDDSDPFATQEPVVRRRTTKSVRKAVSPDRSDPFATQEPAPRKDAFRGRAKETAEEEEPEMDIDEDNALPAVETSSPEPVQRTRRNDRTKSKQKATVYEIPDDTDDEHVHSPDAEPEPSPPQPKKATKPRERARKKTIVQAVEENVDSEPEKPPKGRARRTRKRKPEKALHEDSEEEEDTRPTKAKGKRARSALAFLDDQSSEGEDDDLRMPLPQISKTTKASKAAKTTKGTKTKALRLGKKLKSTVKSREVFGFNSSPPPPPNFGFGAVAATTTFVPPVPAPVLVIEDNDPTVEEHPPPVVSKPARRAKPKGGAGNKRPDEAPATNANSRANLTNFFQRRTSIPDIQPPKDLEPAKGAASLAPSALGESNRQGFGAVDARSTATTASVTGANATVQSNSALRDNQQDVSHLEAAVPGAAKDSGAQQAEQSVISRIEENLKAVGHGGRSGLHTVSHNNAPAPDLPPAPQEQAIRTDSRAEKLLSDVPKGPIIPTVPVPPVAAPTPAPRAQTIPQAQVSPLSGPGAPTVAVTASGVALKIGVRKQDTIRPPVHALPQIQTEVQAPAQAQARPPAPVVPPVALGTSVAAASTTAGRKSDAPVPSASVPAPIQVQSKPLVQAQAQARPPSAPAAAPEVTTIAAPAPPVAPATTNPHVTTGPNVTAHTPAAATATTDVPIPAPATVVPMGPPPRIPNPASRGRKAALKSDAAGQTPQSILPPPDPLTDRSSLLRRGNTHPAGAGGQTEARPKLKMTFPGFVSAREHDGGPWSREAHDLLGGGRPGD